MIFSEKLVGTRGFEPPTPTPPALCSVAEGLFSIWMKVFQGYPEVCRKVIDAHRGTCESECFDVETQTPISPHPNVDGMVPGGRL